MEKTDFLISLAYNPSPLWGQDWVETGASLSLLYRQQATLCGAMCI